MENENEKIMKRPLKRTWREDRRDNKFKLK